MTSEELDDKEWTDLLVRREATLRDLLKREGEEWDGYERRLKKMRFFLKVSMHHLVKRRHAKAGTLQASTVVRNGDPFVTGAALLDHYERMNHPDTRAEIRKRLSPIVKASGAVFKKCECHRARPTWRRALWALPTENGLYVFDAEGEEHRCDPSDPDAVVTSNEIREAASKAVRR